MNVVTLLGRIGRDPETRHSGSGMAICNFSLATSEKVKGEDKTQWHRCISFGKTAELIQNYVKKGDQLGVEGKISYGSYDKDGVTVYTTDIVINRIHFVSSGKRQEQGNVYQNQGQQNGYQNNQQGGYQNQQSGYQGGGQQTLPDDDVPF